MKRKRKVVEMDRSFEKLGEQKKKCVQLTISIMIRLDDNDSQKIYQREEYNKFPNERKLIKILPTDAAFVTMKLSETNDRIFLHTNSYVSTFNFYCVQTNSIKFLLRKLCCFRKGNRFRAYNEYYLLVSCQIYLQLEKYIYFIGPVT